MLLNQSAFAYADGLSNVIPARRSLFGERLDDRRGNLVGMLVKHEVTAVSSGIRLSWQVTNQAAQIHLSLSRLKPAFHRGLCEFLELIRARALKEEIRIVTDVFNGRKCDCIYSLLVISRLTLK